MKKQLFASAFCAGALLMSWTLVSSAATVNYWQFEDAPGFQEDSVGSGTLASPSFANQVALPGSGRGSHFSSVSGSTKAVDLTPGSVNTSTATALTDNFSGELLVHLDNINDNFGEALIHQGDAISSFSWSFQIRTDGFQGTAVNELILGVDDGSLGVIGSGFIVQENIDYYMGFSYQSNDSVDFYVQDLTNNGLLQTFSIAHTRGVLDSYTKTTISGLPGNSIFRVDGLIDEVRLSDTVLGVSELLVSAAVPVPAAVWLFSSGLLGLIGIARRKKV